MYPEYKIITNNIRHKKVCSTNIPESKSRIRSYGREFALVTPLCDDDDIVPFPVHQLKCVLVWGGESTYPTLMPPSPLCPDH